MRRIEILTFPGGQLLDVAGPLQVFATANDLAHLAARPLPYETAVVAGEGRVITSARLELGAAPLPEPAAPLHTLVVAGGYGVNVACRDAALVAWVRQRAAAAQRSGGGAGQAVMTLAMHGHPRPSGFGGTIIPAQTGMQNRRSNICALSWFCIQRP